MELREHRETQMKRLVLPILLGLLTTSAYAEQVAISQFRYLNNNDNSLTIDPNVAQDLLNVDIRPGGRSIKKREGYGLYKDLGTGQGIHGGHHFFDSTGNDVQVWGSSTSLYGIVADATPTQLVSSATLNATWDCADTQGNAYCVNSSRDMYARTAGASIFRYGSPLGTMVEITPTRAVVSGVSGSPNTLYFSESANFINFTTGITETSPFTEVIASPGSKVTHLRYACGKVLWWKDQSFGYLTGENQFDLENTIVSDTVGTFDNTSAIDPGGNVWFRGQDGHIWKYDCTALVKESIDISPNVQASGKRTANSWTQTTTEDFNAGASSNTTVSNNTVFVSTDNTNVSNNSFETSGGGGAANWTPSDAPQWGRNGSGSWGDNCVTINARTGSWMMTVGSTYADTSWTLTAALIDAVTEATLISTTVNYANNSCSWTARTLTGNSSYARRYTKIRFTKSTNGSTLKSDAFIYNGGNITFYTASDRSLGPNYSIIFIDDVTDGKSSITNGFYLSAVRNAPLLTTWDTFSAGYQTYGETVSFFMRSSTNSFTVSSSTPLWQSATAGAVVPVSTGTYFQVKSSFNFTGAGTQTPELNDFTVNWFEGSATDQAYSIYFDNAIWFSLAFGVGISSNNFVFKHDLINEGWTLYNFGAGGFAIQNNRLYFGQVGGDNLFRYGDSTSDNGSSISAYWKSKDYPGADPFLQNNYDQSDTIWAQNTNQSATVTYTVDTSSETSYTVNLSSSTGSIINHRKLLPSRLGYTVNWKFGDSSATSQWELLGYRFTFSPQPYRPSR